MRGVREQAAAASMRPRPDAAENRRARRGHGGPVLCASMRPRPDAAENPRSRRQPRPAAGSFNEAAARCRGKRHRRRRGRRRKARASMRPRPDAAENPPRSPRRRRPRCGFNEAAARCRGKHTLRPIDSLLSRRCFNEAAARCRGKPAYRSEPSGRPPRFNEAAARCRGKHGRELRDQLGDRASMRPRPDAAENPRPPTPILRRNISRLQ